MHRDVHDGHDVDRDDRDDHGDRDDRDGRDDGPLCLKNKIYSNILNFIFHSSNSYS